MNEESVSSVKPETTSDTAPGASNQEPQNANNGCVNILTKLGFQAGFIIGALTLAFSAYQYFDQRQQTLKQNRANQIIQTQSQMRNDLDQLIKFPSNKTLTISGAQALLGEMDALLQSETDLFETKPASVQNERRRISKVLYGLASVDCNFNDQRDVDFSIVLFDSWDDYQHYLQDPKDGPDLIWDLLSKYNDALTELRQKPPGFISHIRYNKDASEFEYDDNTPDAILRPFEDLVRGYTKHLDLLDQRTDEGMEQRKKLIVLFQAATCNREFTESKFGNSIKPEDDPKKFESCPEATR